MLTFLIKKAFERPDIWLARLVAFQGLVIKRQFGISCALNQVHMWPCFRVTTCLGKSMEMDWNTNEHFKPANTSWMNKKRMMNQSIMNSCDPMTSLTVTSFFLKGLTVVSLLVLTKHMWLCDLVNFYRKQINIYIYIWQKQFYFLSHKESWKFELKNPQGNNTHQSELILNTY